MNRSGRRSGPAARRIPTAALAGMLCVLAALGSPASAQETDEPTEQEGTADGTLTWSVRPTPTDEQPDRPNFSYDVEPDDVIQDSIRVRNFGTEPLPLEIYASDAITTDSGAIDLLPAGEEPTAVGRWIVLSAAQIEVPAQSFVDVPFAMAVPAGAESGDHVGGIVTSYRSRATSGGQQVVLDRRLGSRVQVRVGGELEPMLEISDVAIGYDGTFNPFGTGTLHVSYTVTNVGNVRLGAEQAVSVPGRFGFPGREATVDPMPELLPGSSLTYALDIHDVWPTMRTKATLELTPVPTRPGDAFGDPPIASTSESVWSVPWGQQAIVLLVVGVPLWAIWSRRRRERRQQAMLQQAVQTAVAIQEAMQAAAAARDSTTAAAASSANGHSPMATADMPPPPMPPPMPPPPMPPPPTADDRDATAPSDVAPSDVAEGAR